MSDQIETSNPHYVSQLENRIIELEERIAQLEEFIRDAPVEEGISPIWCEKRDKLLEK